MNASSLWVPNNKYGEFSFGKKSPYSGSEFRWYRTYNDTNEENIAFLQNDHRGLSIKISDDEYGTVLSIHAETEVNYLGTNLVGLEVSQFIQLLSEQEFSIGQALLIGDEEQKTLEFDELCMMAWVSPERIIASMDMWNEITE